jgi:hypothetical protein
MANLWDVPADVRNAVIGIIDQGMARELGAPGFVDGADDQYSVTFWTFDGRVYRLEHAYRVDTVTRVQEVCGSARDRLLSEG